MKLAGWALAIATMTSAATARDVSPIAAIPSIAPGTEVELMVLTEVNTRTATPGSVIRLRVNKPVVINGVVVLQVGTPAFGTVESLIKSGVASARGSMKVRMSHIETSTGKIPLSDDTLQYEAKGGKGDDAAKWLLAPFYAPFAPTNSAKLKAGELIHARVAQSATGLSDAEAVADTR